MIKNIKKIYIFVRHLTKLFQYYFLLPLVFSCIILVGSYKTETITLKIKKIAYRYKETQRSVSPWSSKQNITSFLYLSHCTLFFPRSFFLYEIYHLQQTSLFCNISQQSQNKFKGQISFLKRMVNKNGVQSNVVQYLYYKLKGVSENHLKKIN